MSNEENPDPVFKRVLNRCLLSLLEDMDFNEMYDYLVSKEVFRTTKLKDIKDEKYTSEKIRKLIDAIARAGPEAYAVFKKGLIDTKQKRLYDLLNEEEESLAKESKEKNHSIQGRWPVKAATSDNSAQTAPEVDKTIHSRRDTGDVKSMEQLSEDLQRANLNTKNSTQQPTTSTTIDFPKNEENSVCTPSSSARSFPSSQLVGGDSKTAEIRASNVCHRPTAVPANTGDAICQPQTTQLTDSLQKRSSEQPISIGNLTSYQDMYETDTTEDLTSSLKQEHYAEDATNQPQMTTERNDEPGRDQSFSGAVEHGTGAYGQQSSTVGTRMGGAAFRGRVDPVPNDDSSPDTAYTAPGSGPGNAAIAKNSQGSSDESRDDDGYNSLPDGT